LSQGFPLLSLVLVIYLQLSSGVCFCPNFCRLFLTPGFVPLPLSFDRRAESTPVDSSDFRWHLAFFPVTVPVDTFFLSFIFFLSKGHSFFFPSGIRLPCQVYFFPVFSLTWCEEGRGQGLTPVTGLNPPVCLSSFPDCTPVGRSVSTVPPAPLPFYLVKFLDTVFVSVVPFQFSGSLRFFYSGFVFFFSSFTTPTSFPRDFPSRCPGNLSRPFPPFTKIWPLQMRVCAKAPLFQSDPLFSLLFRKLAGSVCDHSFCF